MRLYEITEQFEKLDSFIPEVDSAEDSQAWTELWEGLTVDLAEKVHGYCCVIRNSEGDLLALDAEIKKLERKKEIVANKIRFLEMRLSSGLKLADTKEVKTSIFTVKFAKTAEAVKIDDESLVPEDLMRVKKEPNKTLIKAAIKAGRTDTASRLQAGERLVIK